MDTIWSFTYLFVLITGRLKKMQYAYKNQVASIKPVHTKC